MQRLTYTGTTAYNLGNNFGNKILMNHVKKSNNTIMVHITKVIKLYKKNVVIKSTT